jgi:hypothetical protein
VGKSITSKVVTNAVQVLSFKMPDSLHKMINTFFFLFLLLGWKLTKGYILSFGITIFVIRRGIYASIIP